MESPCMSAVAPHHDIAVGTLSILAKVEYVVVRINLNMYT